MKTSIISLVLLSTVLAHGQAAGWVESITLQPATPTVGDSVTITVMTSWGDSCWELTDSELELADGDSLVASLFSYDCRGRECDGCWLWIVEHEETFTFVPSVAGMYSCTAVEYRDSLSDPGQNIVQVSFEVQGHTPARPSTWGGIRHLFR